MNEEYLDALSPQDTAQDTTDDPAAPYLFTLAGAAAACGVARTTIRRRIDRGEFPNAHRRLVPGEPEKSATWRIPAADLLAAGLVPNRGPDGAHDVATPPTDTMGDTPGSARMASEVDALHQRVDMLERLVEAERRRADDLARVAEQAQRVAELALRGIGSGAGTPDSPPEATGPPQVTSGEHKADQPPPGFWARLFGGGTPKV